jgi:GNAT superfamily N-acetyltransferase
MDPVVRRAAPGDARPLGVLEAEAREALVEARGGARWLDEHPAVGDWAAAITSGDVFVAVLEVGDGPGLVVGYLLLVVELPIARVDQVYVTPEARELGFGDALLEAATQAATAAGARLLEGTALPGDRETKNLYERAGITARSITVSRVLP